jgi:hypothetical protein
LRRERKGKGAQGETGCFPRDEESQKFAIAGLHCATLELVREQT